MIDWAKCDVQLPFDVFSRCRLCLERWVICLWIFLQNFHLHSLGLWLFPFHLSCALGQKLAIVWRTLLPLHAPWCQFFFSCLERRCGSRQCGNHQFLVSRFLAVMPLPIAQFSFGVWLIWAWYHLLQVVLLHVGWVFLLRFFCCCFSPYLLFCFALVIQVARGRECLLPCYSIQVHQYQFLLIGSDGDEMTRLFL